MTPLVLWGAGAGKKAEPGKGFGSFPVLEGKEVPEVRKSDLAIINTVIVIINITNSINILTILILIR